MLTVRPRLDQANRDAPGAVPELQADKMGPRTQKRAIDRRPAFLAAFAASGSLTEAARAVGQDRRRHYDWLRNDPAYSAQFEAARTIAAGAHYQVTMREVAAPAARRRRPGVTWIYANQQARKRDGFKCAVCGFALCLNVHHIIAKSLGGSDELSNLITLCPNHHAMAHANHLSASELAELLTGRCDSLGLRIVARASLLKTRAELKPWTGGRCLCGLYGTRYARKIGHACAA